MVPTQENWPWVNPPLRPEISWRTRHQVAGGYKRQLPSSKYPVFLCPSFIKAFPFYTPRS